MLSYQHMYHAGAPADVHKHLLLAALLVKLTEKQRPITYMETHAGRGLYDLAAAPALKTGEAAYGITALLASDAMPRDAYLGAPFLRVLGDVRARLGESVYPGSPLVAQGLLRPFDVLRLMELHPQEHLHLKDAVRGRNVHVHKRDGYEGVLAMSPPTPRRGLVLIDPSYEVKTEYAAAGAFIEQLLGKWPQAVIMLWYPILPAGLHAGMVQALEPLGAKSFRHEIGFTTPHSERGLRGSGVVVLNMPFGLQEHIADWRWPA